MEQYIMFAMKTTLDMSDTLYREFTAKAATNGEKMLDEIVVARRDGLA